MQKVDVIGGGGGRGGGSREKEEEEEEEEEEKEEEEEEEEEKEEEDRQACSFHIQYLSISTKILRLQCIAMHCLKVDLAKQFEK